MNFPNLIIEPRDFVINCELGSSAEKILTLTNNGPVSVVYKFLWLADSIEVQRDTDIDPVSFKMNLYLNFDEKNYSNKFVC